MATIGTLAAKIVADTSGFTSGMMTVRKDLADTQKSMASGGGILGMVPVIDPVGLGLKAVGAAFDVVAGSARAVSDVVGSAFDRIQDIGNSAQSLGIGVQAFQVLQIAASDADVEMETLTRGIYEMQKSIAAGGTAEKSIEALGLSFTEIKQLAPEDQFKEIAGAIGNATDQSTRVRVINDLFGKSGLELKRLFDGGADAIDDATMKLDRMGAVTEADVKAIGEWDSAWKELKGTIAGMSNEVTRELAPTIKGLVGDTIAWLQSPATKNFVKDMIDVIGNAADVARILIRGFMEMLRPVMDMLRQMKQLHDDIIGAPEIVGLSDQAQKRLDDWREEQRKQAMAGAMDMAADALPKEMADQRDALADDAKRLIDSLRTPFEVIEDKIKHFRMLADLGYIGEGEFDKLVAKEIEGVQSPKANFQNPAMVAGSQAAIQFLANQKYGDPQKATWDAMRKALEQIAKNTKPKQEVGPAVVPAF